MTGFLERQCRSLAPIFRPPFDGLWLTALLYFFWCFLVHPQGQILRGNLPDPDDYMYLDQVLDWIHGQAWYDNVQHRLDPPDGGLIHFTRIPQIPMALLILLFKAAGLPERGAAMITAIILPLFLMAGMFTALRWAAKAFIPERWAGATAFVVLFTTGLLQMYVPGHLDHHGLIQLLITITLGCAIRAMQEPEDVRWSIGAGVVLSLTLCIALEVLPWVIVMSGWFGLWAIIVGGKAARSALTYGLSLYVSGAALLFVSHPPSDLFTPNVMAYSVVYVYFTGGIAATLAGIAIAGRMHALWRWLLGLVIAGLSGYFFLHRFPDLATGPWGGVDPALAKLILDNVTEAQPMVSFNRGILKSIVTLLGPLLAFISNLFFLRHGEPRDRWAWGLNAALLLTATLLSSFYEIRFVGSLGLFMILPLTALLQRGWKWAGENYHGRQKTFAEIGLLLLVGPLPGVLIPAVVDGRSFNTGVLLFPAHNSPAAACDMYGLEKVLRSPQLYHGKPRVIMNTMGIGPELLFRTPDMVTSAPYHEDVKGNLDAVRFFAASDPAKAEAIARQRHVDLVVTCKLIPGMYMNLDGIHKALPDTADTGKKAPDAKPEMPFILKILTGKDLPSWFKPVQSPLLKNYVVYEITPPETRALKSPKGK
jgi:hypothetical protein